MLVEPHHSAALDGQTGLAIAREAVVVLACAAAAAAAVSWIRVPDAVAFLLGGLVAGSLAPEVAGAVTADTLLVGLLPGIVFAAAARLPTADLRRSAGTIGFLAVPGVALTAGIVAAVVSFGVGLRPEAAFVLGAIVAATDPAAVVATFDRLGAPRRLTSIIEAESLLNDGTGIALFAVALVAASGTVDPATATLSFALILVVSSAIGIMSGAAAGLFAARTGSVTLGLGASLVAAYGGYVLAARLGDSGLLAAVAAGLTFGLAARGMSADARGPLAYVWRTIETVLTAAVFLAVGVVIAVAGFGDRLGPIAWGVAAVFIARAVLIFGVLGGGRLAPLRPAVPASWLPPLFWSGLRGGVATAAALSLPSDLPERELLQRITFGIVLVTLLVQGSTAGRLVRRIAPADQPASTVRTT